MTEQRHFIDVTEKEREGARESRSSSSSTTTTTMAHGAGRVLIDPQDLEAIRTGYYEILGPLNSVKARIIEAAFMNGVEASAILDALEQTALARRPSHAYLCAILRRYMTFGIRTAEAAQQDRDEYAARREAANRERAAWYADPADNMPF